MSDLVKIELPFSGFYESLHDEAIDSALEDGFNYNDETGEDIEPPDFWMADINHSAIRKEYCENYVEAFAEEFDLKLTFDEMTSPREYNFSSDRLFCKIPRDQIDSIRKTVEADSEYPAYIKECFTSRDGFWSFYSNDYRDEAWTAETLDECQYEVIIQYWIDMLYRDDPNNNSDWNEREYYMCEFEMLSWDSIHAAHKEIDKYLKEKADEDVQNAGN